MSGTGRGITTRQALLVAAALLLYWVMVVSVSPRIGVTADEVVHVTGGYSYWKFNDYRLHPENGTLPMRIGTAPMFAMDLEFPSTSDPHWLNSHVNLLGETFFFSLGNPVDRMLLVGRATLALCGVFVVWLTWRWARGLFGPRAGWLALALAVFCPTFLAHGGLITSDMTLAGAMLAALSVCWLLLHRATWPRWLLAGIVCGLTFLSKMSGVIIVPLLGLMLLVRIARGTPLVTQFGPHARWWRGRVRVALAGTGLLASVGALSLVVLWAGYGFRYSGFNTERSAANGYYYSWDVILDEAPLPQSDDTPLEDLLLTRRPVERTTMTQLIGWLRDHRVLPEAYLWGFAHTYKFARYRPAFLLGEFRATGWPQYFPLAFLLKTPLPLLVLGIAGAAALLARKPRIDARVKPWLYRATPLAVFFVIYWLMAVRMNLNIGHRHILPTYPVFIVLASATTLWLTTSKRRLVALALVATAALHAADSITVRPHYLSYFQPAVGGPARGYRYLVDSSYDWGQGLPDLARWLDAKRERGDATPVFLTYFGADSPRARGLDVIRFADDLNDHGPRDYPAPVRGGWFVIGATHFQRVYLHVRGDWTEKHEALYRDLLEKRAAAAQRPPANEAEQEELLTNLMALEMMQFGRVSHFLHAREPEEIIGGSLLAFRLTDEEVFTALYGPPPFR